MKVSALVGDLAQAQTTEGLSLILPAAGRQVGEALTAILHPADFTLGANAIPGTVRRAVHLGSDLHLFVTPGCRRARPSRHRPRWRSRASVRGQGASRP